MDTSTWIVIGVVAAAVVLAVAIAVLVARRNRRRRRTASLRDRFGPEYERLRAERGGGRAEDELEDRLRRHDGFRPAPLPPAEHELIARRWDEIQATMIDAPARAVVDADRLLEDAMVQRGFPDDRGDRVELVSVDDPELAQDHRAAHATAVRAFEGGADTEECRQALLLYRRLFAAVLDAPDAVEMERTERHAGDDARREPRRAPAPEPEASDRIFR